MNRIFFVFFILIVSCADRKKIQDENSFPLVRELWINLDTIALNSIYQNPKGNTCIPISISNDKKKYVKAKMRIRGDSSREYEKKSLKIIFNKNEILGGEQQKINLNSEWTDKSYLRQYLSAFLMKKAGVSTFHAGFVKLFINDLFFGLYLQVENMDEKFLSSRDLNPNGNMYKATKDGASLSIHENIEKRWEKKSNKNSDWHDLKELIRNLNTVPEHNIYDFLKTNFEYEQLISIIAMNMLIQNGSTYYHNYYLYHDIYGNNKWQLFPWDMDKTMSYYCWQPFQYDITSNKWLPDNALVERVLTNKQAMKDVMNKVNQLGKTVFNNNTLDTFIDNLEVLLEKSVEMDATDQIKSVADWKQTLQTEKNFIKKQVEYLNEQFRNLPRPFSVFPIEQTQISPPKLKWNSSFIESGNTLNYRVFYSKDYLFEQEGAVIINNLTDTFFELPPTLEFGKYFWKVQATNGKLNVDGYDSQNSFEYKKPIVVKGEIKTSEIWKKENSPYYIAGDIILNKNATLSIERGTEIILKEHANITAYGNILINGYAQNPVIFRPENNSWGLIFLYNQNKPSLINHAVFKEGIFCSDGADITISNSIFEINNKNLVEGEKRNAIIWVNRGNFIFQNNQVFGNGMGEGMNINFAQTVVSNSYFNNTPDAIELLNVNNGKIERNFVENSPDDAIDFNGCKDVIAEENYLFNNRDKGISVGTEEYGPSINIIVRNNLIVKCGTGVSVKDSSNAFVSNNTIIDCNTGVQAYLKNNVKQYSVGGKAKVSNTIFYHIKNKVADVGKNSEIKISQSLCDNAILEGEGNLQKDPEFINPQANNYLLKFNDNKPSYGCFPPERNFLELQRKDSVYVLKNPNIFSVNIIGYYLLIDGKKEMLPAYVLRSDEEIILTSNSKGMNPLEGFRYVQVKNLKKNNQFELFDNKENLIFSLK